MNNEKLSGERKGLRLYFWNLWYSFVPLIVTNFFFVLCCIPVVTIGPALAALCRICCLLAAGKPLVYPVREFWDTFRGEFRRSIGFGLLCPVYALAVSYCLWLFRQIGGVSLLLLLFLAAGVVLFAMTMLYVFPQIAMLDLTARQILSNSFRLMLVRLKESVLALTVGTAILALPLLIWPMSMLLYIVLLFSAAALACCSLVWPGIARYLIREEESTPGMVPEM